MPNFRRDNPNPPAQRIVPVSGDARLGFRRRMRIAQQELRGEPGPDGVTRQRRRARPANAKPEYAAPPRRPLDLFAAMLGALVARSLFGGNRGRGRG